MEYGGKTTDTKPRTEAPGSTERFLQLVTAFSNALVQTLLVLLALSVSTVSKVALICGILGLTVLTIFPGILRKITAWLRHTIPERTAGLLESLSRWVQGNIWGLLVLGTLVTVAVTLAVIPKDEPWKTCPIPDEITFLASDETAPAVQRAAGEFMGRKVDWWGCRQVNINVSGLRADETRDRLSGWTFPVQPSAERTAKTPPGARPDGWIADSPEEITYVRGGMDDRLTFGEPTTVATSPLVIAAPPDLADDLTEDNRNPGDRDWADLLRGRAGTRQVVRTHPLASNVGLMATVAAPDPAEGVSTTVRLGDNVHDVMCRYVGVLTAPPMILTEQQLHEFNLTRSNTAPALLTPGGCAISVTAERPPPLTAVYPKGGHALRYTCVSTRWANMKRPLRIERTVEEFCDSLRETLPRYGFRNGEGRLDTGGLLVKAPWLRTEAPVAANWKPPVSTLLYRLRTPLAEHVLVLVDGSGSMARNKVNDGRARLEAATQLARLIVTLKRGRLTTGVGTFFPDDGNAAALAPVPDEGEALAERLTAIQDAYRGGSNPDPPMRPIIRDALDQMRRTGNREERRAVLVLTDGGDPSGLTERDFKGREGIRLVMLSFDLHGCETPPLPDLHDKGLMSCYDASTNPEQALDDVFTELRTATG